MIDLEKTEHFLETDSALKIEVLATILSLKSVTTDQIPFRIKLTMMLMGNIIETAPTPELKEWVRTMFLTELSKH
jgi:hypothetical protein